jgi:type II secretory ATPase GspE/PulE/Tfp pilus assembly ATPase PilB-like protein
MGLFGNSEPEVESTSGGFLKRFRGKPVNSFVEDAPAAAMRGKEPQFRMPAKASSLGVSFLGRSLSGGDVEDVEAFNETETSRGAAMAACLSAGDETDIRIPRAMPSTSVLHGAPMAEQAASMGHAYEEGEKALRELDALIAAQSGAPLEAQAEIVVTRAPEPTAAAHRTDPVAPAKVQPPSVETSDAHASDEDDDLHPTSSSSGRPALVSADALPDFKRVITGDDGESTLRVSAAARKEFVAVEIQPGVAIVAATARFAERAQFATFLKDLAAHDLVVQEEMIASEAVIAAIYEGRRVASLTGEREASRAIGNFRDIIEAAHGYGASDIAFEPRDFRGEVEVRFRVNGDVYTYRRLPKNIVRRALSAAYSDLVQKNTNSGNSFQPSAPQSAMIPLVVARDTINLRWQSAPTVGGYDVALRLLDGNFKNYTVLMPDQMGLAPSQLALIDTLNYVSGGITVLTGETGSGKTTLLRALSYMLPDRELKKQFAVSEPSEYPLPWLSEISIIRRPDESDDEANRKYAEVIRTLMRMDPDDVTISEVRDRVVMGLVSELALTGHPVRFSLHAGDIISAVMRMAGGRLQLPIDELAAEGFINAVGNQKLVPTLCPHCKLPAERVMLPSDLKLLDSKFGLDTSVMACRNHEGCEHCRLEGLLTRDGKVAGGTKRSTLVAELYRPTPEFRARIAQRDWSGAREVWRGERKTGFDDEDMTGKTLYEHALFKVSRGEIDPQFINRSMQSFAQYRVMPGVGGKL